MLAVEKLARDDGFAEIVAVLQRAEEEQPAQGGGGGGAAQVLAHADGRRWVLRDGTRRVCTVKMTVAGAGRGKYFQSLTLSLYRNIFVSG